MDSGLNPFEDLEKDRWFESEDVRKEETKA